MPGSGSASYPAAVGAENGNLVVVVGDLGPFGMVVALARAADHYKAGRARDCIASGVHGRVGAVGDGARVATSLLAEHPPS